MGSYAVSLFLLKLSKHIALLAIFLILGRANFQYQIGETILLVLVVTSALIDFSGRRLRHRAVGNQLLENRRR